MIQKQMAWSLPESQNTDRKSPDNFSPGARAVLCPLSNQCLPGVGHREVTYQMHTSRATEGVHLTSAGLAGGRLSLGLRARSHTAHQAAIPPQRCPEQEGTACPSSGCSLPGQAEAARRRSSRAKQRPPASRRFISGAGSGNSPAEGQACCLTWGRELGFI